MKKAKIYIPSKTATQSGLGKEDKWILSEAALNQEYTLDDIFRYSDYLIAEECHPVLFELELVNPEVLPDEHVS